MTRFHFLLSGVLSLLVVLLVADEPFFWDTIQLGARHADWFYQNNFTTWLLPDNMDSGHIPAFGWYLAVCWKLFGQSLWVSHFAMWPWVGLVIFQSILLARKFRRSKVFLQKKDTPDSISFPITETDRKIRDPKWLLFLVVGVLLLDATLVAQLSLLSPDVILVGAFLWGINAILTAAEQNPSSTSTSKIFAPAGADASRTGLRFFTRKKPSVSPRLCGKKPFNLQLSVAVILLGLVSLRGMMVAVGLFVWQLYLLYQEGRFSLRETVNTLLPYLPGGALALLYLAYHYYEKGWIGTHADSPWAASFASSGGISLLKQTAIVGWRLLDFGRVFLFLALLLAWWRSGWAWTKGIKSAFALVVVMGVILALPAIVSPGLAQHRYLLPVYLSLGWLFLNIASSISTPVWRKGLLLLVLIGQLSGHFWVYPDTIAQGWDASLAHKPYVEARAAGLDFLRKHHIALSEVGTTFPDIGPLHWRDLNGEQSGLQTLDFPTNTYIWYSNINNDFTDAEMAQLHAAWTPVFSFRKRSIHLTIYQKNLPPSDNQK